MRREFEMHTEAAYGMDEALAWHTMRIICDELRGVGTGTAMIFAGRHFILTAAHVLKDTALKDLIDQLALRCSRVAIACV